MKNIKIYFVTTLILGTIVTNFFFLQNKAYADGGQCTKQGTGECEIIVFDCYTGATLYTIHDCNGTIGEDGEIVEDSNIWDDHEQECWDEVCGYVEGEYVCEDVLMNEIECWSGTESSCQEYECGYDLFN